MKKATFAGWPFCYWTMGKSDRRSFPLSKAIAACAVMAYFVLTLYRIDFQSIWYDEGLTVHYSSLPLLDGLGQLAQQSVHPPLYFALMHFWIIVAGASDFALRLLSAGFGALFVAATFVLGARLLDRRLGALLALVTATSPFVVYYGQEARMYTAAAFLSTLSAAEVIAIVRWGRGYVGFAVVSACAVMTHYFSFLVLGSEVFIGAPVLLLWRRKTDLVKWLWSLAAVALVFAPWAANLLRVAAGHEDFWREKLTFVGMLQDAVLHFSLGEVAWPDNQSVYVFYAIAVFGLIGMFRRRLRPAVLVAVAALFVSFSALVIFPRATYVARYMLVVAPAFYLLVAAGIYNLGSCFASVASNRNAPEKIVGYAGSCLAIIMVVLLLGANAIALLTQYFDPASFRREDFKSLAAYLQPKLEPGDGFVFVAGPLNHALFHYLPERSPYTWIDGGTRLASDSALPGLEAFLRREDLKRIWLIRSLVGADDLIDPDRVTQARVKERFGVVTTFKDVRGVFAEAYDRVLYTHYMEAKIVDITYGSEVLMSRYRLDPVQAVRGGRLEVELFWQPRRKVSRLLWVSLQVVERESGTIIALADFPAGGLVPTTTWGPGMVVADEAVIQIPGDAPASEYDAYLIVYDPATQQRLTASGGPYGQAGDAAHLFSITLPRG